MDRIEKLQEFLQAPSWQQRTVYQRFQGEPSLQRKMRNEHSKKAMRR